MYLESKKITTSDDSPAVSSSIVEVQSMFPSQSSLPDSTKKKLGYYTELNHINNEIESVDGLLQQDLINELRNLP